MEEQTQAKKKYGIAEFTAGTTALISSAYGLRNMFRNQNTEAAQKVFDETVAKASAPIAAQMGDEIDREALNVLSGFVEKNNTAALDPQDIYYNLIESQDGIDAKFQDQFDAIEQKAKETLDSSVDMSWKQKALVAIAAVGAVVVSAKIINALRNEPSPNNNISTNELEKEDRAQKLENKPQAQTL